MEEITTMKTFKQYSKEENKGYYIDDNGVAVFTDILGHGDKSRSSDKPKKVVKEDASDVEDMSDHINWSKIGNDKHVEEKSHQLLQHHQKHQEENPLSDARRSQAPSKSWEKSATALPRAVAMVCEKQSVLKVGALRTVRAAIARIGEMHSLNSPLAVVLKHPDIRDPSAIRILFRVIPYHAFQIVACIDHAFGDVRHLRIEHLHVVLLACHIAFPVVRARCREGLMKAAIGVGAKYPGAAF